MTQYNSRYDEYFQNNKDLQDFWEDTSQQGLFAGGQQGKYYENYGVDAAGAEKVFVDGMNKKFGTNYSDMRDFTKDQFAQYHYDTYGANEGRAMKSAQEFLDSKLPKPDSGSNGGNGGNGGNENGGGNGSTPGTTIGDGNEFGEGEKIGNNVGKDGNINTTIGNDNIFGDNATIGNDYSQTTGNGSRSEAKERAENYQEGNTTNVGKVGDMNTSIGDRNTFGDNATIGNDFSTTIGGSGGNSGSNTSNGSKYDGVSYHQVTPPPISGSGSGSGTDINVNVGYGNQNSTSEPPSNPFSNIVNNYLNVGKRGDMNTSIGNNNTFGHGANIGNDYSVTIGGSGDGLSNMQGAAAYTALNNNQRARSNSFLNGMVRGQQAIDQAGAGGWLDMAANAYNMVGMSARNSFDRSTIQHARNFGDYHGDNRIQFNMPGMTSPKQPESKVDEILKGFNKK